MNIKDVNPLTSLHVLHRKEVYSRSKCPDCKGVFWSRDRIELHKHLGFCNANMIASIR